MLKTLKLNGYKFSFNNFLEFLTIYKDVFVCKDYKFVSTNKSPVILDCGSHIGISVLYFKKIYPNSKIFGFEPNPSTFKLLKNNVRQNNCNSVELKNVAIGNQNKKIDFYIKKDVGEPSWSDTADLNVRYEPEKYIKVKVNSIKLSKYLKGKVDFIKLDVEGFETKVLEEIGSKLKNVMEITIEYHHNENCKTNNVFTILKILRKYGFKYVLKKSKGILRKEKFNEVKLKEQIPEIFIINAKQKK